MRALTRPVSPDALEWAHRLLGVALAALALQQAMGGHLGVHAGALYGRRPAFLPLLPPLAAGALWLAQILAGGAVALGLRRRWTVPAAAALALAGLSQAYFNQGMFLFLTLTALALESVAAARAQLLLLYIASAAFKLRDGFWTGDSLEALLVQVSERGLGPILTLEPAWAPALSKAALLGELALPALLLLTPAAGVAAAAALHLGFALALPGLWPFTATALAAALLFLPRKFPKMAP
ncbi:MAG: hypothetical protein M0D55_08470 [Elusimicrobiota bacterium]|nr:MAG: hypothetical protein M0D55_08470 [Elusimicrobiota bacterium]